MSLERIADWETETSAELIRTSIDWNIYTRYTIYTGGGENRG